MKKTYIITIVLILVAGVLLFISKSKKLEAPTPESGSEESGVVSKGMPALDAPGTKETIVTETPTPPAKPKDSQSSGTVVVKEFMVLGQNFSFTPSVITVKKGDKVKITFQNTQGFHDFVIDEYGVATKKINAPSQEVLEFTADKIGSFEYYCSIGSHRSMGMKGILKVE